MKLEELSGVEIGRLVNAGELLPTQIIDYFFDRIKARNPSITAYTYARYDEAIEAALALEHHIQEFGQAGPLAGVPVCLKDFLPSKKGWHNSHGGVECLDAIDTEDSEFCKAAEELGAIVIGKTNAPPFGFSGACTNKQYGTTKNPFDTTRTSGGSSGGTAAAVADGLAILGEGGDAGGSIRIPAGWCNLFGMKPSLGTVPSVCRPDAWSATHPYCFNGCLTKTVEDSALMLTEMAHYDPRDPHSLPINSTKDFTKLMNKSIKGIRIGLTFDFDLYPQVENCVKAAILDAAQRLQDAGAIVTQVHFNWSHTLEDIMHTWAWAISLDTALDIQDWKLKGLDLIRDHSDQLTPEFIEFNDIAAKANIHSLRHYNEVRTDILDNFENVFDDCDLILSPVAVCRPLPNSWNGHCLEVNDKRVDPKTDFISFGMTPLVNFVGYPAASVPADMIDGLPVGMQLIGRQYHDEDVFAVARTYEQIHPWRPNYKSALNRTIE